MASLEIPTIRAQRDTMELAFDGDTLGQPVNFTIRYRGNTTGVGPEAWYSVAPAPDGSLTHFHAQEIWLQASVVGEDGLWTGSFTLPEWWPEGDYLVVTNVVFTPNETAWPPLFGELRWDVIHLNESGRVYPEWEPPPPPDPVGTSETFIPGPGPAALLVAVAAGAVAWDRGRRRPKR